MKRLLFVVICVSLFLPLQAQEEFPQKKPFSFARQHFEFGIDAGVGIGNDLVGINDIFRDEVILDLNNLGIGEDGFNLYFNVGPFVGAFFNLKNLRIAGGRWDIGFFAGGDGSIRANIPESIFKLISEGNRNNQYVTGMIGASGAIHAQAGMKMSARYNRLRLGFTPSLFAPLIYIPSSGFNYVFDTTDGIRLGADGEISVYCPFIGDDDYTFSSDKLKYGFDISMFAEFSLFSFLELGGSVTNLPISPAILDHRMKLTVSLSDDFKVTGQDLMDGKGMDFPDVDFDYVYDDPVEKKVYRPLRFDVYARFKPFGGSELLVLRPNLGFTVDVSEKEGYYNMGLEARLNLGNVLIPYVSVNREEGLYKNRFGLIFNLRIFELGVEAAMQSQELAGSFKAKGLDLNAGIRFGF